jgi:transketolase
VATSVGMAIAGQWLRATYNRPGYDIFDFNVYALCGDGDMMEGISSEAASLAGHLRLSNLCWIYDSNRVTTLAARKPPECFAFQLFDRIKSHRRPLGGNESSFR